MALPPTIRATVQNAAAFPHDEENDPVAAQVRPQLAPEKLVDLVGMQVLVRIVDHLIAAHGPEEGAVAIVRVPGRLQVVDDAPRGLRVDRNRFVRAALEAEAQRPEALVLVNDGRPFDPAQLLGRREADPGDEVAHVEAVGTPRLLAAKAGEPCGRELVLIGPSGLACHGPGWWGGAGSGRLTLAIDP